VDDGSPPEQDVADGVDDEPSPDADPDDEIPSVVLAAVKDRMHARRFSAPDDPSHVRASLGTADDDLHVVDDGPDHCTIGRPVGHAPDGCVYVLVARVHRYRYEQLRDGDSEPAEAFSDARDVCLCAVYEVDGTVQNIALVRRFRRAEDVPDEYLPPSPFLEFTDDDPPDDVESTEGTDPADGAVSDQRTDGGGGEPAESGEPADGGGSHRRDQDGGNGPTHGDLLIDEDALTDEPARAGLMHRVFARTTGFFRRVRRPAGRSGFPGI